MDNALCPSHPVHRPPQFPTPNPNPDSTGKGGGRTGSVTGHGGFPRDHYPALTLLRACSHVAFMFPRSHILTFSPPHLPSDDTYAHAVTTHTVANSKLGSSSPQKQLLPSGSAIRYPDQQWRSREDDSEALQYTIIPKQHVQVGGGMLDLPLQGCGSGVSLFSPRSSFRPAKASLIRVLFDILSYERHFEAVVNSWLPGYRRCCIIPESNSCKALSTTSTTSRKQQPTVILLICKPSFSSLVHPSPAEKVSKSRRTKIIKTKRCIAIV